ncbi:Pimeloyl-ACP methyl ester carboxylesterase [Granulicella pectinivorans]|uniref:Pimeloyl-ACP methyl ester carboxylesterase n=1 Tax=Granulicella pectinivorans TaxID=474950 RepID=A0A1I6LXJ3_9BACT|nr:alpha/beta hydrolase [Granulicella pectinivorans]SFS08118.1 Pimeloyl-ACP methyl ester carboxylesterase [Granulicella pectinivorans]
MKFTIGHLAINIEDEGSGDPALLFLHYWGGTHRTWSAVISALSDSYRCVAYDSRGWGRSEGPTAGFAVDDLANEALGIIDKLELRNYVLVGHSMGGKVAQLLASRRPSGLRGLILVAPAAPVPRHFPEEALQQQLHAYDNRETVLQAISLLSAKSHAPDIVEGIVEDSLSGSPAATQAWPTIGILEDISSDASKIIVPTLVVAGGLDNLDSVEQHKREVLSRIPNSELVVIADSGHLIPIDEPIQLAAAIRSFVSERL